MDKNLDNSPSVTKANSLIEASYRLSLDEQRLVLACISKINPLSPSGRTNKPIRITADEYAELFNLDRRSAYKQLKAALNNLWNREIIINQPNGKKITHRWLPDKIEYPDGEGKVEMCFNPSILPYLSDISDNFKSYKIKQVANLRSAYTIRIYELLNQYLDTGWREVSLNRLREMLQVGDKYKRFTDIRQWVLEPAQKEMEDKTNIVFTWEALKTGRKVTAIRFKIKEQEQMKLALQPPTLL